MENKTENKARFFHQYADQIVWRRNDVPGMKTEKLHGDIFATESDLFIRRGFLSLRSISSLTDEEAGNIAKQNRFTANDDPIICAKVGRDILKRVFEGSTLNMCLPFESADYLRSNGILIPWMDLSVEQIIEYGWAKENGK